PRARKGQLADAELQRLVPGVRLSVEPAVGQPTDRDNADAATTPALNRTRILRMAAWRFEPKDFRSLEDFGSLNLVATGYVVAPQRGNYRLSIDATSPAEVSIGEQVIWRSERGQPLPLAGEVELAKGYNPLRIVQTVEREQLDKPVSLRLLWSAEA